MAAMGAVVRSREIHRMHVLGHGDPVKLATALHAALAETKTPLSSGAPTGAAAPPTIDLDTTAIDQTLGSIASGKVHRARMACLQRGDPKRSSTTCS
jgi:hypothetical protein